MHRSWNSVCLNHYIASLENILLEHHGEFGAKTCSLTQMNEPSASGTDFAKNNVEIIENDLDHFDFAHDHVVIQA